MKKLWLSVTLAIIITVSCLGCVFTPTVAHASEIPLFSDIEDLFFPTQTSSISEKVYLSGKPIAISIEGEGVVIIGINEFVSTEGVASPALKAGLALGDIIIGVNDRQITSVSALLDIVSTCNGDKLRVLVKRDGKTIEFDVVPCKDVMSNVYKLGVWIRDSATGIGTLTYIRKNLQFGSLGHPIMSQDTKQIAPVIQGAIFDCTITGVVKGERGKAGELKGQFDFANKIGRLFINNKYGAYGNMDKLPENFDDNLYQVASAQEVKPGNVKILTCVDGDVPKLYDAEIIKVVAQSSISDKGIVLRITDKELLGITGGIVQGMSGSPIIQGDKFVGAVTHVFINDPTKGYGILAQWMLEN